MGESRSQMGREAALAARKLSSGSGLLLGWKMGAEVLTISIGVVFAFVLAAPLASEVWSAGSPSAALAAVLETATRAPYLAAIVAGLFSWVGLSWGVGALTDAMIWGRFEQEVSEEPRAWSAHLSGALAWRALRGLVRAGLVVWGMMLYAALLMFNDPSRPAWLVAGVLALCYAGGITAVGLVTLAIEAAPARMVVHAEGLGEALLESGRWALEELPALYRMFATAAGVLLGPAMLFWVFELTLGGQTGPWVWATRAMMQVVLALGFAAFLVSWRGATILWAASLRGVWGDPSQEPDASMESMLDFPREHVFTVSEILERR